MPVRVWEFCATPSNTRALLEVPLRLYRLAEQMRISLWVAARVTTLRIAGGSNQNSCSLWARTHLSVSGPASSTSLENSVSVSANHNHQMWRNNELIALLRKVVSRSEK